MLNYPLLRSLHDRQCTYNVTLKACLCKHRCIGKAIIVTYYERVFVALGIQHALHIRHIAICGLSVSSTFLHIISETARFSRNKYY